MDHGGENYASTRYSTLSHINTGNVGNSEVGLDILNGPDART